MSISMLTILLTPYVVQVLFATTIFRKAVLHDITLFKRLESQGEYSLSKKKQAIFVNLKSVASFPLLIYMIFALIPVLGIAISICFVLEHIYQKANYLELEETFNRIINLQRFEKLYRKLPAPLILCNNSVLKKIEILRKGKYHPTIAEEGCNTLLNIIKNSFVDDCLIEKYVPLINEAFEDLEKLLDKFLHALKIKNMEEYESCQQLTDESIAKYRSFLQCMILDLDAEQK